MFLMLAVIQTAKSLSTSLQPSKLPAESGHETGTICTDVLPIDICDGLYVIVQLLCKSGKKITPYRYVGRCICQKDMDEDGALSVGNISDDG